MAKTKPTDEKKNIFTDIDWKELTPIGFEFNTWTEMKGQDWTFPELKEQFKEGGVLSETKNQLYLFLGAQPIVGKNKKGKDFNQNMPYIVVIDCESELPSKIAKVSIQNGEAEISDFKEHHLMWAPYVLPRNINSVKNNNDYKIYTLTLQERSGKQLSEEKVNNIQYLLPYALIPKIFETEKKRDVNFVQFYLDCDLTEEGGKKLIEERKAQEEEYKKAQEENKAKKPKERVKLEKLKKPDYKIRKDSDGKEVVSKSLEVYFDKLNDKLKDFLPEFVEDNNLTEDMEEKVEKAIREQFAKEKAIVESNYNAKVNEINTYSDKKKNDLNSMKIYKFYPTHPSIDTQQFVSNNINRFLGSATKTFPEPIKKDLTQLKLVDESVIKKIAAKEIKEITKEYEKNKAAAEKEMKEQEKKATTTTTTTTSTKGKKETEEKENGKVNGKDEDAKEDVKEDAKEDVKEDTKEDAKEDTKEDTKEEVNGKDEAEEKKPEKPTEKSTKKQAKKPAASTNNTDKKKSESEAEVEKESTTATNNNKRKESEPEVEKPTKSEAKSNKKQKN